MAFETKIKRARFVVGPFSPEQMAAIGQVTLDHIMERIRRGVNVQDAPAKRLSFDRRGSYGRLKVRKGLQPIRDWTFSGATLHALKVKSANENRVVLGFIDPKADAIAHINNLREKQFGLSPSDMEALRRVVAATRRQARVVRTTSDARPTGNLPV